MKLPRMKDVSEGERWWVRVRMAPLCQQTMPLEAALSLPIPGVKTLHLFHFLWPREIPGTLRVLSRVTASLPKVDVIELRRPPESLFPGLALEVNVKGGSVDANTRDAVLAVIPALARQFPSRPAGPLGRQFVDALNAAVPPDLMPYYTALNPEFFSWCLR